MSRSSVYEYGLCWCGKPIEGTTTSAELQIAGKHLKLESVPQGVCRSCGFKYYKADILETIEALLNADQGEWWLNVGFA